MAGPPKAYVAEVKEVHSGDDLVLLIDLGHDGLYKKVRARLKGVDTPDAYKSAAETEAGEIRSMVHNLTKKKRCAVDVHSTGPGGWVVSLYLGGTDAQCLNDVLIDKGYVFRG